MPKLYLKYLSHIEYGTHLTSLYYLFSLVLCSFSFCLPANISTSDTNHAWILIMAPEFAMTWDKARYFDWISQLIYCSILRLYISIRCDHIVFVFAVGYLRRKYRKEKALAIWSVLLFQVIYVCPQYQICGTILCCDQTLCISSVDIGSTCVMRLLRK